MQWYLVKIVFQIRTGSDDSNHQFDESFRMIEALDLADAYEKAYLIGQKEQSSFSNLKGNIVEWRFVEVPDVIAVGELKDGVELFSTTAEEVTPEEYINVLHNRAGRMKRVLA